MAEKYPAQNVRFLGHVAAEAKWDLLRQVQAVVVPSTCYENMPLAVLESWAVATPVIVSAIGSLPYIVAEGDDGLTFPAGDVDDLRDCLQALLSDPGAAREMGHRGRLKVEREYSEIAHYNKLMAVYRSTISRTSP